MTLNNNNGPTENSGSFGLAGAQPGPGQKTPNWFAVVLVLCLLSFAWWQRSQREQQRNEQQTVSNSQKAAPRESNRVASVRKMEESEGTSHEPIAPPVASEPTSDSEKQKPVRDPLKIENQVIKDIDGRVVFRGEIDLKPTLDRIASGEKNSHHNDGTLFQNRERRLPAKPHGYYTEFVHPTKGIGGPGPQRIIIGKDGDVWYTPDHYRSFERIK